MKKLIYTPSEWIVKDGKLIKYNGTKPYIVLPKDIISINEDAFIDNQYIQAFSAISSNLRAIGPYAFYRCPQLEKVRLPKTLEYVGKHAFTGCPLKEILYEGSEEDWLIGVDVEYDGMHFYPNIFIED